ncbi:MAG: DUF1302 family protein [Thermodesulfobacteriota bacterium]|nr:DUF1302 family protein [Thermodesulfobacteriota bacterium]
MFASRLHHIFNRSSIAKVLEIARYSCGFVQSDRLNLRQIRAQILPSYFLPNPKLGRQIVVWGKSDNIRVTDVLNPLDMREPGLTDIEDLRFPVAMSKLDYYIGDWSLTGIAIHEIRFNKSPEYGSDFYSGSQPPPHEDKPDSCCKNTEYAAAINGIFSGWDISFYWTDYYNDMPNTQLISAVPPPQTEWKHARLKMFGAAFNQALGNWLLKAETVYIDGFEFFNRPGKEYSRIDVLAGIEYSGFKDTTVSIEAVKLLANFTSDGRIEVDPPHFTSLHCLSPQMCLRPTQGLRIP